MVFYLKRLDANAAFVLLLDNFDQLGDDLVCDVIRMTTALQ